MRLEVRILPGAPNQAMPKYTLIKFLVGILRKHSDIYGFMTARWIVTFGHHDSEQTNFRAHDALGLGDHLGSSVIKDLLGGKGSALLEMSTLGINVPHGFTISTEICQYYYKHNKSFPVHFVEELTSSIKALEVITNKKFGPQADPRSNPDQNPLLVSVRSGAKESMPGMMDTILNLGLNDQTVEYLATSSSNTIFALDSYRRLIQMYSNVVLGVPMLLFEAILETYNDNPSASELRQIIRRFKALALDESGMEFPQDVYVQLQNAVRAVINSWMSSRAVIYRKLHNISSDLGTAVTIQSMVFGNKGKTSGTGVVFSRNPSTGEKKLFGEYLINAQGEDVVSGVRTPYNIDADGSEKAMIYTMPKVYADLKKHVEILEAHYKDVQDIEFTIENGELYILQTRAAKRTTAAAIKIVVDMVAEGLMTKQEAIMKIDAETINQLLHARVDYDSNPKPLAKGLPASPGAAVGIAVFSPYDAEELAHHHKVILVRNDTSPEDIRGMNVSAGVLTVRGGMTSHAAVVARGMGKPCICGASRILVNEAEKYLKIGDVIIKQGDELTIDGSTGKIFAGTLKLVPPTMTKEFDIFMCWVDEVRYLRVRANAETILDANTAVKLGAEGIGLCRTEHMFFRADKIALIREMIVSPNIEQRSNAIARLLPIHTSDFKDIFRIMQGMPVNIRLLDPPLHEFLPQDEIEKHELAKHLGLPWPVIENRLNALHEVNPMLGHRGCRLGITFPEIYEMQVEAIFNAISDLRRENIDVVLEIMLPLISDVSELRILKKLIICVSKRIEMTTGNAIAYTIGTMLELPRAALKAEDIATEADYFSFGTNDLTQTTFGISRDDIASFMPQYLSDKLLKYDPFITIDQEGVGELIKIAIERGKRSNPRLKLGVCGEHGGDPRSILFFHDIGLDYISCSPYRIPIARIAAAQAKILSSSK